MGLDLSVGLIADLRSNDSEGAEHFSTALSALDPLLKSAGLLPHVEPDECACWSAQMYGYSGLHYLRRIAAYVDAGQPLPPPGDNASSEDPLLAAYYDAVAGKTPGLLQRITRRSPRFSRSFDHLLVHSDAEGFYLPQDFRHVLFAEDEAVPGGMVGSVPRLLAELERLAAQLAIPDDLHAQSEDLWEAAEAQGEGVERWQQYGIESFCCVVLREACRRSLATGAAIIFC